MVASELPHEHCLCRCDVKVLVMSKVECQQQNIFKIRDGIPGHGPQRVVARFHPTNERVQLECGCSLPLSWLPNLERDDVLQNVKPPVQWHRTVV